MVYSVYNILIHDMEGKAIKKYHSFGVISNREYAMPGTMKSEKNGEARGQVKI